MKFIVNNIFKKLNLILFFYPFPLFAQTIPQEIPVQTQPLQGVGVQRVGSAPIPISVQNIELMASPSVTIQRPQGVSVQLIPVAPKKLPYDTTYMTGRVVYLNGVNISSVKNQELENVNIHIDGNGNVYIDAPHYEIGLEQSYHPLMPSELPKFPKTEFRDSPPVPNGVYSKETGKMTTNKGAAPILPKEFAPEVPIQDQAPFQPKATPATNENKVQSPDIQTNESKQEQSTPSVDKQEQSTPSVDKQEQPKK